MKSGLLFFCLGPGISLPAGGEGFRAAGAERLSLWISLAGAQSTCGKGPILAIDPTALDEAPVEEGADRVSVQAVPAQAVRNLDPYLPPVPVTAAGGYVVRRAESGPEVLLIYRRGAWDLPKGKLDPGETIAACALREVREEVGIHTLHSIADLGTTLHGYPEEGVFRVKTTHWFLMETPERRFAPQEKEGIEEVAWVPWPEAMRRIGYETLREHMQEVEAKIEGYLYGA